MNQHVYELPSLVRKSAVGQSASLLALFLSALFRLLVRERQPDASDWWWVRLLLRVPSAAGGYAVGSRLA